MYEKLYKYVRTGDHEKAAQARELLQLLDFKVIKRVVQITEIHKTDWLDVRAQRKGSSR